MTYGGVSHVIGHPPYRASQYALPAVIRSFRAATSPGRRMIQTLAGRVSLTSFLSSFPRLHFSQYGFGILTPSVVALPGNTGRGHDSAGHSKRVFHRSVRFNQRVKSAPQSLPSPSQGAVGSRFNAPEGNGYVWKRSPSDANGGLLDGGLLGTQLFWPATGPDVAHRNDNAGNRLPDGNGRRGKRKPLRASATSIRAVAAVGIKRQDGGLCPVSGSSSARYTVSAPFGDRRLAGERLHARKHRLTLVGSPSNGSPRPIGSFLKSACKRSQLSSCLSWLSSSFRLQADGRSLVFVGNDPVPVGKIDPDHVAHSSVSQSIGKPGWPAAVISQ